jgi:thiamine-phosphate pyrophosphorylase
LFLYLIVDAAACGGPDGSRGVVETARQAAEAGVDFIQYRDLLADDESYLAVANKISRAIDESNAALLISERPHLLEQTQAIGVHVGETFRDLAEARRIIGPEAMLGASGFSAQEVLDLVGPDFELDYLSVGPVWATVSKADAGAAIGVAEATELTEQNPWPTMLVGGITAGNIAELANTDAAGIVVLGEICRAPNVADAVQALGSAIENF